MAQDIFDVDSLSSIVRQAFQGKREINLKDYELETYELDPSYETREIRCTKEGHASQIRVAIEPVSISAERRGYNPNIFTAMYEAVLNAYQHGNREDPAKKVILAHKIDDVVANIAVIDEGGIMDPSFVPFVLRHREGRHKKGFLDFYEFTEREKPERNNGTGISFMHTYVDEVGFFKSEEGGLVVHLTKFKDSPREI